MPKKLLTSPPMKVGSGYALAQVHHASVMAAHAKNTVPHLSHLDTVIVLQVPTSRVLIGVSTALWFGGVPYVMYRDRVSARHEEPCFSAIVTGAVTERPLCLRRLKLWK